MKDAIPIRHSKCPGEEGYILLGVLFMVAVLSLGMAVAARRIAKEIQRDREVETMQRGKQYVRAIKLYYHKFGRYPPNLDALVETSGIHFLRTRYLDPMTGKDDWKPIMLGQNKTPLVVGFFGEPIGVPGSMIGGGLPPPPRGGPASDSGGSSPFGTGGTGTASDPGSTAGSSDGTSSNDGSGSPSSGTNPTGQTFGGAGIIGVSPASAKESIIVYKKKIHYNEWEFLYSPLSDRMIIINNPVGQPPLQGGAPGAPPQPPGTPTPTQTTPQ